jgi:putative FmdB family regulatory protein
VPIYEYRCGACGEEFEQLSAGQPVVACPACQSAQVTRRFSLFGVRAGGKAVGAGAGGGGCGCGRGGCGCH